jgi:N6-adenosine-specific RNA methylase IME4
MDNKDICNLNVKELADDNCILFLWATFPKIQEALDVIKAW